jgi:hypothetical protein
MCSIWHSNVDSPERRLPACAWLALTALTVLACYANAVPGDFQFDDYNVIVDNPAVQSWDAWRHADGQGLQGIRPLLKITYLLNWMAGWGAPGFHLVNVAIHFGNSLLVYALAQAFLSNLEAQPGLTRFPCATAQQLALCVALTFAVHPVNTEAVTYICGRSTSLMALFYLAGVWMYVSGRTTNNKLNLYLAVPLLFGLALGVKETAVTFPLALLAWEWVLGGTVKAVWRRQWPVWVLLLAGAIFFLFNDNYLSQMQRSAELNTLTGNVATQAFTFSYLMRQWVLPLWLNIDPDLPLLHEFSAAVPYLAAMLAAVILIPLCRRKKPWISLALMWALVHLVPLYILLPRLDVANDRQMYLSGWPLALAIVAELALWLDRTALSRAIALLLISLSCVTVWRNQDYRSEIALWEATAKLSPDKARVHNNLGYAYKLAGRTVDARREFTTALRLDPNEIKARYNLQRLDFP